MTHEQSRSNELWKNKPVKIFPAARLKKSGTPVQIH